jgi:hypothetical protein
MHCLELHLLCIAAEGTAFMLKTTIITESLRWRCNFVYNRTHLANEFMFLAVITKVNTPTIDMHSDNNDEIGHLTTST